jgi:hypothetical protein
MQAATLGPPLSTTHDSSADVDARVIVLARMQAKRLTACANLGFDVGGRRSARS